MDFQLVEFLSFRGEGARFLIPAFILGNGGLTYAQVVGENGMIEDFRPIEADHYHAERQVPLGETRRIGEPGLFAARLRGDVLLHGDYDNLSQQLARFDLQRYGAPFFNVDAYAFIGDAAQRRQATDAASALLGERIGKEWRALEAAATTSGLRLFRQ